MHRHRHRAVGIAKDTGRGLRGIDPRLRRRDVAASHRPRLRRPDAVEVGDAHRDGPGAKRHRRQRDHLVVLRAGELLAGGVAVLGDGDRNGERTAHPGGPGPHQPRPHPRAGRPPRRRPARSPRTPAGKPPPPGHSPTARTRTAPSAPDRAPVYMADIEAPRCSPPSAARFRPFSSQHPGAHMARPAPGAGSRRLLSRQQMTTADVGRFAGDEESVAWEVPTAPRWPDARPRCRYATTRATTPAWSHATTSLPSTRYSHLVAAVSPAWTRGKPGSGYACANPADGWRAPMTHPTSTPKHTTKKPTIPSSPCSSTRTRDGATSTSAPPDGLHRYGEFGRL